MVAPLSRMQGLFGSAGWDFARGVEDGLSPHINLEKLLPPVGAAVR